MSNYWRTPTVMTHCGQLGDFVYCWPIAASHHARSGRKIHWVLPDSFGPFRFIVELLRRQSFTEAVTLVPYRVQSYGHGGQPYRFNPNDYLPAEKQTVLPYYNLGFRGNPDKFIPAYVGEEHGLDWLESWKLDLGCGSEDVLEPAPAMQQRFQEFLGNAPTDAILRYLGSEDEAMRFLKFEHLFDHLPPYDPFFKWVPEVLSAEPSLQTEHANWRLGGRRIDLTKSVLFNARWMAASRERLCFYSSLAVILYFARVPFVLGRQPGHPSEDKYFPDRSRYELRHLPA